MNWQLKNRPQVYRRFVEQSTTVTEGIIMKVIHVSYNRNVFVLCYLLRMLLSVDTLPPIICSPTLTANDAQTGLEAVVWTLQPQLVVHLGIDVLQRWQSRTSRVTVVPAHQRQPAHEQVLTDLEDGKHDKTDTDFKKVVDMFCFTLCLLTLTCAKTVIFMGTASSQKNLSEDLEMDMTILVVWVIFLKIWTKP